MRTRISAAIMAAMTLAAAPPAAAQLVTDQRLDAATQQALAKRAIEICASRGAFVAVAIADPNRAVRTALSHDRASATAVESARRKAISAAVAGNPTSVLTKAAVEAPAYIEFLRSLEPQLATVGGGVPIRVRGALVGAIGVGGAPGPEPDESCANAAIAAVLPADRP